MRPVAIAKIVDIADRAHAMRPYQIANIIALYNGATHRVRPYQNESGYSTSCSAARNWAAS